MNNIQSVVKTKLFTRRIWQGFDLCAVLFKKTFVS